MRPVPWFSALVLVAACHGEVVENPAAPAPAVATTAATPVGQGERTRVQVRVLSCLPVGYGVACACEVGGPDGQGVVSGRLEACVGDADTLGLVAWLEDRRAGGALPLSLWMDVAPAPESARYCGIVILESGVHQRVVDFERAR